MTICASEDSFGAYSENGIWAAGDTVEACKADVERAISLIKRNLPEEQWPPPIKGDYEIEWQYESLAGMERVTGVEATMSIQARKAQATFGGRRRNS